jgi:hypothetical protein
MELIKRYNTQFESLSPDKEIKMMPEKYYISRAESNFI